MANGDDRGAEVDPLAFPPASGRRFTERRQGPSPAFGAQGAPIASGAQYAGPSPAGPPVVPGRLGLPRQGYAYGQQEPPARTAIRVGQLNDMAQGLVQGVNVRPSKDPGGYEWDVQGLTNVVDQLEGAGGALDKPLDEAVHSAMSPEQEQQFWGAIDVFQQLRRNRGTSQP